jgi:polar amino acid transport system substrate-binding protein
MKRHMTSTGVRSLLASACVALVPALTLALTLALLPGAARAACDFDYTVKAGDTYYSIAAEHYGHRREWQRVYQANQSATGMPTLLPGNTIYIPCAEGVTVTDVEITSAPVTNPDPAPNPAQLRAVPRRSYPENAELKLLTGGNYAPFTDQDLPGEGMVTELLHAALDITPSPVTYSVTWENDWSQHLFPLLDDKAFDMGFPWLKPDCQTTPEDERCANFLFSEPLMTLPIMLFVRPDTQFRYETDADIIGKSLCRPVGYFTHDLDRSDRRWLAKGLITFVQGKDPADCFNQVLSGKVDAATVNLFLGANLILEMGLRNKILPLEKPLSEEGLHVVISKRHWRGTTRLYRVNAGLQKLKDDGRYQEIVSRHMELFRAQLQ